MDESIVSRWLPVDKDEVFDCMAGQLKIIEDRFWAAMASKGIRRDSIDAGTMSEATSRFLNSIAEGGDDSSDSDAISTGYAYITIVNCRESIEFGEFDLAVETLVEAAYRVGICEMSSVAAPYMGPEAAKKFFSEAGRRAVEARYNQPGGYRDKKAEVLAEWNSGKYKTKAECAKQIAPKIGISEETARKALRTPSR